MTGEREKAREIAFGMMLAIVNEWQRQVGIDEVMKSKLTRKIADTVATGVIERTLGKALTQARHSALLEAAAIARERSAISHDGAKQYPDGSPERRSETCAGIEAEHIACLIEQAAKEK